MRTIINYIRSCFCQHEWELIFESDVIDVDLSGRELGNYRVKTYRCKKCGYSKKYKSH